jgi:hypothetical protein
VAAAGCDLLDLAPDVDVASRCGRLVVADAVRVPVAELAITSKAPRIDEALDLQPQSARGAFELYAITY